MANRGRCPNPSRELHPFTYYLHLGDQTAQAYWRSLREPYQQLGLIRIEEDSVHRELLLLGVLRQGNLHGYGINEFIQRDMAFCTDLKKPTAYHLLRKMAAAGWIQEHEIREGNRPARRMYHITPEGEAAFQRLLRENLSAHFSTRFDGDIGLAFITEMPAHEALTLLRERQVALSAEQATLKNVQQHGEGGLQLILEHQKRYLAFELAWLDEVVTHLSNQGAE